MLGAQCQNHTNKKTSTYQCLKTQPLNFQHSFHFTAKIGLSKCHPVAKNSRGGNSSEIRIVYFKDGGTWLLLNSTSTPKGRACNLSRTANLAKVRWDNMQAKYLEFLLKSSSSLLQRPGPICFFSRCETEQQLSFLVLACRGTINHLGLTSSAWSHSFFSTVGRMTGEKWVKHGHGTLYPPVGAQSPAYAAAAGVSQCHALFKGSTDLLHQDLWAEDEAQQSKMHHRQLFCYINIFLMMKTFTVNYKSCSKRVSPHRPPAFDSN